MYLERCLSGRKGHPAKVLTTQVVRRFESSPLRQKNINKKQPITAVFLLTIINNITIILNQLI